MVGRDGKKAIVGVKAGARLGKVRLRRGYAEANRVAARSIVAKRTARTRTGAPIGAGKLGRVRSRGARGPADDRDRDGIPDPFDIDDDGDLTLDKFDRGGPGGARAAQQETQFLNGVSLDLPFQRTVNVNAGSMDPEIDEALRSFGYMGFSILGDPGSAELDCASTPPAFVDGRPYCKPGGTGRLGFPLPPGGRRFPGCCDSDGDGMGTLVADPKFPRPAMVLTHGANSQEIRADDLITERFTRGGAPDALPATLQLVFTTVPALQSYSDTAGTPNTPISYPNQGEPLPVKAPCQDCDVILTLTFWRPQRRRIAADPTSEWIDIVGLNYSAANQDGIRCPQNTFAESHDRLGPPNALTWGPSGGGFADLETSDLPASKGSTNTLTYTLNLTQCLASKGLSFGVGETRVFSFLAIPPNGIDTAMQNIPFRRTS